MDTLLRVTQRVRRMRAHSTLAHKHLPTGIRMSATVILKSGKEKSLLRRHPWVFSGAIQRIKGKPLDGEVVNVHSAKGDWLAQGSFSSASQIQVRVWSFNQQDSIDQHFFEQRIRTAWHMRQHIIEKHGLTGVRVIAAENDGFPGITIDKFDNVLVCQILTTGGEFFKALIIAALNTVFPNHCIYERSDVAVRKKENLELTTGVLAGNFPDSDILIKENGFTIKVDPITGHKTGFYLDQRDGRAALEPYVKDKTVLNCFCYTGTFGLYALRGGATKVTNVDVSEAALHLAEEHVELNNLPKENAEFVKADVFELLREYQKTGKKFDVIVLDPPKFADNKGQVTRACRGYKDINRLALTLLNPNGYLLTFSCSGLISQDLFQKVVADAALDANREISFVERLHQAADHPTLSSYPEGYYLKGFVCQARA